MVKHFWIYLFLLCYPPCAFGQVRVAGIFADNMVVQRDEKIPVWGKAEPGTVVTVGFSGHVVRVRTDREGRWKAELPPVQAGGPYRLTVQGESGQRTFDNVMAGDVWYASGQSNMEHPMQGWAWLPHSAVYRYEEEREDSDYPEIRLFTVPKYPADQEATELPEGKWEVPSPETLPAFSSTAWFFAKRLYAELKIPIGIINCSWAGTPIHAWMSRDALQASGETVRADNRAYPGRKEMADILKRNQNRRIQISYPAEGEADSIHRTDKQHWKKIPEINTYLPDSPISYLEKKVYLSERQAKESLLLSLGFLNSLSHVYFNGRQLGTYTYPEPVFTTVSRNLTCPGENTITIRLSRPFGKAAIQGADSLFYIKSDDDSFRYGLSRDWIAEPSPAIVPQDENDYRGRPSALFNGMVNPLTSFNIKGMIWYQGEDDASQASTYRKKFESLITDYRTRWRKKELPFLFVQLSSYVFSPGDTPVDPWTAIRQAQNITLPHTGKIVSTDLGDPYDVHPRNKKAFGERLATEALKTAYGIVPVK